MRAATRQNGRKGRQRTASLKQQEERNCACANADSGKQRVIEHLRAEFLIPTAAEPNYGEVNENGRRRTSLNNKATKPFADALGRHTCQNLLRAIKDVGTPV